MKKIILASTAALTLLFAGTTSVFATVDTLPNDQQILVPVTAGGATFSFNDMTASTIVVDASLITGTQTGTLSGVGGD